MTDIARGPAERGKWAIVARLRQAEFRNASPTITPAGRSPTDPQGRRHEHLLALGHEDENLIPSIRGPGGARRFFEDRRIKWWRGAQSGDAKGKDGPTRNMTSSQIACVNFFLPLAQREDALLAMLHSFDEDATSVVPLEYRARNTERLVSSLVELEWVGRDSTLEGGRYFRGANATSADALIVAEARRGVRRAYLFEWKYAEQYGRKGTTGPAAKTKERLKRYKARYEASTSPFTGEVSLEALLYDPVYQLMRFGLLGQKMIEGSEFGVTEARVVVVCPSENTDYLNTVTSAALQKRYQDARSIEQVLKQLWRDPAGIRFTDTPSLLGSVRSAGVAASDEWAAYNGTRYL